MHPRAERHLIDLDALSARHSILAETSPVGRSPIFGSFVYG
jgi:hypothetical protein